MILLDSTVGGGEVLQYIGNDSQSSQEYIQMNNELIKQLGMLPAVKIVIFLLAIVLSVLLIMKLLEIKSPFKGKALKSEMSNLDAIKKHDAAVLRANKLIATLTRLIEKSPLTMDKTSLEYWSYNIERANIRIPGGNRVYKPQELNAVIKSIEVASVALGLLITILISVPVGLALIMIVIAIGQTLPFMTIRKIVNAKDDEIVENFADFYLMLHYVLLASAGTPISGIMKSYDKTTSSEEMHRLVDCCVHYIDTYGEYEATKYIDRQYREIPQVKKLMRLIRQANEGGDIRAELIGFRSELLEAKKYQITKRMEKVVAQAKASFNILVPILIQAIISAMAIYFEDLQLTSTFL